MTDLISRPGMTAARTHPKDLHNKREAFAGIDNKSNRGADERSDIRDELSASLECPAFRSRLRSTSFCGQVAHAGYLMLAPVFAACTAFATAPN
jgi:hypothetical protein